MKDLLLLFVVIVLIATNVLTQDSGKEMADCRGKGNKTYTHHVPHETDCHKFYKCLGGRGFLKECPNTSKGHLVFNPEEQVCDWEENVPNRCYPWTTITPTPTFPTRPTPTPTFPTRPTPTPTFPTRPTSPPTTPEVPTGCWPGQTHRLPHETDCHYYYVCSDGRKERCRCYNEHKYNQYTQQCDLPGNVPWCTTTRPVSPSDYTPKYGLCPPQSILFF